MSVFEWDPVKSEENRRKHGVGFETVVLAFEDPAILSRKDLTHLQPEERYNALGEIAPGVLLFVVFTWREIDGEEMIRLISARSATAHEKRIYEEAKRRAETGHRNRRRQDRRYD